jgi:hypothetical protein
MNRRNVIAGLVGAIPLGLKEWPRKHKAIGQKCHLVEVLKHSPNTRYEVLRSFQSEEEAVSFVKALRPRIASITLAVGDLQAPEQYLTSGWRNAIRGFYRHNQIVSCFYEIIDTRTEEIVIPLDDTEFLLFDCGRAWAVIENIRVNGKPIQMHETEKIPLVMIQPLLVGKDNIHYVDLEGKPLTYEQGKSARHDERRSNQGSEGTADDNSRML